MTYKPGMKMYEAAWEREGRVLFSFYTHAASATDAVSEGEVHLAESPEDIIGGRDGATVRVDVVRHDEVGIFIDLNNFRLPGVRLP